MKKNTNLVLILNVLSSFFLLNTFLFNDIASADEPIIIDEKSHDISPSLYDMPEKSQEVKRTEVRPYAPPQYEATPPSLTSPIIIDEKSHDISPSLHNIPEPSQEVQPYAPPQNESAAPPAFTNPLVTPQPSFKLSSLPINGFQGVGIGLKDYQPTVSPPDTNGAAGPTQYVQWINPGFGIFDKKTGKILDGFPKSGSTLFTGTGGLCETTNRGDGIVKYDQLADRWVITKFAFSDRNVGPFAQCVAVSVTSDATGPYYRYEFPFDSLNDYGKLGMWPNAYYLTLNMVGPKTWGPRICALNRQAMLQGQNTSMQCFQLDFLAASALLPGDLDGKTLPPAGTPEYLMGMQKPNTLKLYTAQIDFNNSKNSKLSGPVTITVDNFTMPCEADAGDNCAPQPNTTMKLDTMSDRLLNRLAYRQFSDHGSLLATHDILNPKTNASMIRWYEIRFNNGSTTPTLYQTGNHSIINNGWGFLGSMAMDKLGNIAIGYSRSSATLFPSIGVSARLASAPLGKLSISTNVIKGTGSQTTDTRWGDYAGMSIDPVDDCTFWFTTEYRLANASSWSTYIASFKLPGC